MHRLEIKDAEIMQIAVQQELQRSEDSRYDHRLHGILLILNGFSAYQVAELFGQSPRTVQYWVKKFEKVGFAGLEETPKSGRRPQLDSATAKKVGQDLRRSPRDFGHQQNLWDGKLLSHHLQEHFGVSLGVRQCQRLFHELGFRLRKPRPAIAHSDPQAQQALKKTPSFGSRRKD